MLPSNLQHAMSCRMLACLSQEVTHLRPPVWLDDMQHLSRWYLHLISRSMIIQINLRKQIKQMQVRKMKHATLTNNNNTSATRYISRSWCKVFLFQGNGIMRWTNSSFNGPRCSKYHMGLYSRKHIQDTCVFLHLIFIEDPIFIVHDGILTSKKIMPIHWFQPCAHFRAM
jgi:hypothetical protein